MTLPTDWQPSIGAWPSDSGIRFGVWAPDKHSIDVQLERPGENPLFSRLQKMPDGIFVGVHPSAKMGDLYRYRVNEKEAYPDPASRFQPKGVHGPSQIIDPTHFAWSDSRWKGIPLRDLVIYELHVGTFSSEGTFEGVTQRLSHLVQLGVTAIELMPLADFSGDRNWGYDGVALFAPARCYGQPDDLRRLVDTAHGMGLAVLIDVVYNHFGPEGNYTGVFSPHYVKSHQTAWGSTLNFDDDQNAFVRSFFIQNALHWIHEYHVDGLRLDATHAIVDKSARHFLSELTSNVQESGKERIVHVIAEDCRNLISLLRPAVQGGDGLSAVWSDDFHHQVRRITAGDHDGYFADFADRIEDLATILNQGWLYSGQNSISFKGPRGTDPRGTPLDRFVFFIQNHDQIGNRAFGDRLHEKLEPAAHRAVAALLLCLPQIPLLFMGQEWATDAPFLYFTDHNEELGRLVKEGRAKEFRNFLAFRGAELPDPQSIDTFLKCKLRWSEIETSPHSSVWAFYQALLKWRKAELAAVGYESDFLAAPLNNSTLLVRRMSKNGKSILVLVNLRGAARVDLATRCDAKIDGRTWAVMFSSEDKPFCLESRPAAVLLSGKAPVVEFARPGAVILKEHL